jgi:inosine-uridine nucleoside N-ribohydrolase
VRVYEKNISFLSSCSILLCFLQLGCDKKQAPADNASIPVIIDCDSGVDDAIALCIAAATDQLDVKAVTSVFGNSGLNRTTYNILTLADYLEIDAPIAHGKAASLGADSYGIYGSIHGNNGLGDFVIAADFPTLDRRKAWDVIYDTAKSENGNLQLIALGPLTNIATALELHPDLPDLIDRIVIMGGSTTGGNQTDYAEFNIHCDPAAAEAVFSSGIDIVMVGLDVTHQTYLSSVDVEDMMPDNCKISYLFNGLSKQFAKIFPSNPGINLHDPLAVIYSFDPTVASGYQATVTVDVSEGDRRGETKASADKEGNVLILESVDNDLVMSHVSDMFQYYSSDSFLNGITAEPAIRSDDSTPIDLRIWQGANTVYSNDDGLMELSLCVETNGKVFFLFDEYFQALSNENFVQYFQIEHIVSVEQNGKEYACSFAPTSSWYTESDAPVPRLFSLSNDDAGFDPSKSYTITIDHDTIEGVTPSEVTSIYSGSVNIPFTEAGMIHFIPLKNNLTLILPAVYSGSFCSSYISDRLSAYRADGSLLTVKPILWNSTDFELFSVEDSDDTDWARLEISQVELTSGTAYYDEVVTVSLDDEIQSVNLWGLTVPIESLDWTEDGLLIQFEPMGIDLDVSAFIGDTIGVMDRKANTLFFPNVVPDDSVVLTFVNFTMSSYQPIIISR